MISLGILVFSYGAFGVGFGIGRILNRPELYKRGLLFKSALLLLYSFGWPFTLRN